MNSFLLNQEGGMHVLSLVLFNVELKVLANEIGLATKKNFRS